MNSERLATTTATSLGLGGEMYRRPAHRGRLADELAGLLGMFVGGLGAEASARRRPPPTFTSRARLSAPSGRPRTILRMHFVDGLNIDQIGSVYGVHRATVARWIARSRDVVLEAVKSTFSVQLRLTPREFSSLVGDLDSQLYLSLHRLLESDCVA